MAEKCSLINIPFGLFIGDTGVVSPKDMLCAVVPSLNKAALMTRDIFDRLNRKQEQDPTEISRIKLREFLNKIKKTGKPSHIDEMYSIISSEARKEKTLSQMINLDLWLT